MKIGSIGSAADVAKRNLKINTEKLTAGLEQLSSGSRINSAKDDPVAAALIQELAKSETALATQNEINSRRQSELQIDYGGATQNLERLQDLRAIAVQAANGTLDASARQALQSEASNASDLIEVDVSSASAAEDSIEAIDAKIEQEAQQISRLSAESSALRYRESANSIAMENMAAARSAAQDTDIAQTLSEVQKMQVLSTLAATAMNKSVNSGSPLVDLVKKASGR